MNETPNLVRTFDQNGFYSIAEYSHCETYRYALTRTWDASKAKLAYVMLNPSTADERQNDPTVERCERRARMLGYGCFRVVNIFAFRATDPADLKKADAPEGPDNKRILSETVLWADALIAAWGAHGDHRNQGASYAELLRQQNCTVAHLGLTKAGHPRHPLYVSYNVQPVTWDIAGSFTGS